MAGRTEAAVEVLGSTSYALSASVEMIDEGCWILGIERLSEYWKLDFMFLDWHSLLSVQCKAGIPFAATP